MVRHQGLPTGTLWAPPGGGLDFGKSVQEQLITEFREETGLEIEVGSHLFSCELLAPPLHAIELFFSVRETGGELKTGYDPETRTAVIHEVRFMSIAEVLNLPEAQVHGIFRQLRNGSDLAGLSGFYRL
jgi:ADP-ribose pyrophosphatase YjhB (NUDIX family)